MIKGSPTQPPPPTCNPIKSPNYCVRTYSHQLNTHLLQLRLECPQALGLVTAQHAEQGNAREAGVQGSTYITGRGTGHVGHSGHGQESALYTAGGAHRTASQAIRVWQIEHRGAEWIAGEGSHSGGISQWRSMRGRKRSGRKDWAELTPPWSHPAPLSHQPGLRMHSTTAALLAHMVPAVTSVPSAVFRGAKDSGGEPPPPILLHSCYGPSLASPSLSSESWASRGQERAACGWKGSGPRGEIQDPDKQVAYFADQIIIIQRCFFMLKFELHDVV